MSKQTKFRPHTVALLEIHWYPKTSELLLWKMLFQRLIWEIMQDLQPSMRFQGITMGALLEAAEACLIGLFEEMNLCAIHTKWVTICHMICNYPKWYGATGFGGDSINIEWSVAVYWEGYHGERCVIIEGSVGDVSLTVYNCPYLLLYFWRLLLEYILIY